MTTLELLAKYLLTLQPVGPHRHKRWACGRGARGDWPTGFFVRRVDAPMPAEAVREYMRASLEMFDRLKTQDANKLRWRAEAERDLASLTD